MNAQASVAVVVVAAGRGVRAGPGAPKQWRPLAGRAVLAHTLDAFAGHPRCDRIVLVLHPDDMAMAAGYTAREDCRMDAVAGGPDRAASVLNGLEALAEVAPDFVLIHDAARPLVSPGLIDGVLAALEKGPAAAPALAVTDALWTGRDGRVTGTRDRDGLFRAQTPQGFHFDAILAAHRAHPGGATDDVAVARAAGLDVTIVPGDPDNLKITGPADFARAERLLRGRMGDPITDIRLGNGYDVHAFTEGDHVTLCGVSVPHDRALLGHSDADVGLHAITDAIYGALADGDIGQHFPPSDPRWKGAESDIFLVHARDRATAQGFAIGNVDVTLVCERPKVGPHAPQMAARVAELLGISPDRVSVKATTSERLGFTGREEGIAAIATATLVAR